MLQDELLHTLICQGARGESEVHEDAEEQEEHDGADSRSVSYPHLMRIREQLESASTEWTLELPGCMVRRVGNLLTASLPAATSSTSNGQLSVSDGSSGVAPGLLVLRDATVRFPPLWTVDAAWVRDAAAPPSAIVLHRLPAEVALEVRSSHQGDQFHP